MDTIAVVGAGPRALTLLAALAESRYQVVSVSTSPKRVRVGVMRMLPIATRAAFLGDARFDCDLAVLEGCSFVVEAEEGGLLEPRARFLATLEARLSEGAALVAAGDEPDRLASALARPEQFLGLGTREGRVVPVPCAETGEGVLFAAERLVHELSMRSTLVGLLAPAVTPLVLGAS